MLGLCYLHVAPGALDRPYRLKCCCNAVVAATHNETIPGARDTEAYIHTYVAATVMLKLLPRLSRVYK